MPGKKTIGVFWRTGQDLPRDSEKRSVQGNDQKKRKQNDADRSGAELFRTGDEKVGRKHAHKRVRDIQKLVVVINVRLKDKQLTQKENKDSGNCGSTLLTVCKEKGKRNEEKYRSDIFQPEPKPVFRSRIYPVEV